MNQESSNETIHWSFLQGSDREWVIFHTIYYLHFHTHFCVLSFFKWKYQLKADPAQSERICFISETSSSVTLSYLGLLALHTFHGVFRYESRVNMASKSTRSLFSQGYRSFWLHHNHLVAKATGPMSIGRTMTRT